MKSKKYSPNAKAFIIYNKIVKPDTCASMCKQEVWAFISKCMYLTSEASVNEAICKLT